MFNFDLLSNYLNAVMTDSIEPEKHPSKFETTEYNDETYLKPITLYFC